MSGSIVHRFNRHITSPSWMSRRCRRWEWTGLTSFLSDL